MRFSAQLFPEGLFKPAGYRHLKTSALLSQDLLAHIGYPGLPTYTPLGVAVLDRIESALSAASASCGYDRVQPPVIMKDSDLYSGEPVGEQFASKVVSLRQSIDGYHLLTSPEMMFINALGSDTIPYRRLPLRIGYLTDIFRNMKNPRSILRCRQFRVFGCMSLCPDPDGVRDDLKRIVDVSRSVLDGFGVGTVDTWSENPSHAEILTRCQEGGTHLEDPAELTGRVRALSLSVGYHYAHDGGAALKYRSPRNTLEPVHVMTYALCTNRVMYCVFDSCRDEYGFSPPASVRPLDVVVVADGSTGIDRAEALYSRLADQGWRVGLDDRVKTRTARRTEFADYIGAAAHVVVSSEAVTVRERGTGVIARDPDDCGSVLRGIVTS